MIRLTKNQFSKFSIKRNKRLYTNFSNTESNIELPEFADVVIIGGGSAGCNALYHLAKRGINTVLLERSKLTSGTTWHTAGLVWSLRGPNDVEMEMLQYSIETFASLEKESGIDPGWINNGGLCIAHTAKRMAEYERLVTTGKVFNVNARIISPSETEQKFPFVDKSVIEGAIYSPRDGVVDPAMLINSLTKIAKSHGCKVIENCPVNKILTREKIYGFKEVCGIETPHGTIKTNAILNASGAWSRNLLQSLGLDIPLVPIKHAYVITEPIEGVKGLPNLRDADSSVYYRIQGSSICIGGYENNPIMLQNVPNEFSFGLYELDWNVFNAHIESMIQLMPKLANIGIKTTICGPESFTPDHKPIIGEDPRCSGLFYSCGYNSAGMMLGPGCGNQVAEWIISGRPEKHMFQYDIRRFLPEQMHCSNWATERSHEAYVKNYNIAFPHEEPLSGRNFIVDPFHDILLKKGAVMEERQGWERPGWYLTDETAMILPYNNNTTRNEEDKYKKLIEAEYTFDFSPWHQIIGEEAIACRTNVALFNMSYFGKFYLCGPEVQEAADYLFTADTRRDFDRTIYTCMLNYKGGVEADCTVTSIRPGSSSFVDPIFKDKAFYIVSSGMSAYQTWAHMHKAIKKKNFQVSLHDFTQQIGVLSVQGPKSKQILQTLLKDELFDDKFPFSTSKLLQIENEIVRLLRISFVGEYGFELHIPRHSCKKLYEIVMAAGYKHGIKLAGYRALYSLSCEKGYHLWGSDLRTNDNPVEAGLGFVCRKTGTYIGKEKVDQLLKNGTKKKLVHLHLQDNVPMWGLETVYRNGQLVGFLRRAEYGYTFGRSIGHAYIKHPEGDNVTDDYLKSGAYEIEIMGKKYPAKLYLRSPFDPDNKRMKGMY